VTSASSVVKHAGISHPSLFTEWCMCISLFVFSEGGGSGNVQIMGARASIFTSQITVFVTQQTVPKV